MPIAWDETNPTDNFLIPSYPANARAFRAAVKAAWDIEHDDVEGRHKFAEGNTTARDLITDWVDGSLWCRNDIISGHIVLERYNGSAWEEVVPPANYPTVDGQSQFTVCQFGDWETVSPSGGNVAIDLSTSPMKVVTAAENITILAPTNPVAGYATTVLLDIVQGGVGGYTVTWNAAYRNPQGAIPLSTSVGDRNLYTLTYMANGQTLVLPTVDWNNTIT